MVNGQWSTVILLLSYVATFFLLATTIKVVHRGAMRVLVLVVVVATNTIQIVYVSISDAVTAPLLVRMLWSGRMQ